MEYFPSHAWCEIRDPDATGAGELAVSMPDGGKVLPLFRYRTGDRAKLLDNGALRRILSRHSVSFDENYRLPLALVWGRAEHAVRKSGPSVHRIQETLYADPWLAARITGHFRVREDPYAVAVQATAADIDGDEAREMERRLADGLERIGGIEVPVRVVPFAAYPYEGPDRKPAYREDEAGVADGIR
jgi:hypothetical protein